MTACRCRAEFCFICTAPWKTCECAQWDEDRLPAGAEEIYDRDGDGEEEEPREEHECDHQRWRSRLGRFRCEHCWADMRRFIYV